MSENPAGKPRLGLLQWALWGAALIGVAAVVYIMAKSSTNPQPKVAVALVRILELDGDLRLRAAHAHVWDPVVA